LVHGHLSEAQESLNQIDSAVGKASTQNVIETANSAIRSWLTLILWAHKKSKLAFYGSTTPTKQGVLSSGCQRHESIPCRQRFELRDRHSRRSHPTSAKRRRFPKIKRLIDPIGKVETSLIVGTKPDCHDWLHLQRFGAVVNLKVDGYLFRTARRKTGKLTTNPLFQQDAHRIIRGGRKRPASRRALAIIPSARPASRRI